MNPIEKDEEALNQGVIVKTLLLKTLAQHECENKRLWAALIACIICIAVMAVCAVWAVSNAQSMMDEALRKALNSAGDVTTTTVTQDTGEGNGNAIYQAGEHATYAEGGGD